MFVSIVSLVRGISKHEAALAALAFLGMALLSLKLCLSGDL